MEFRTLRFDDEYTDGVCGNMDRGPIWPSCLSARGQVPLFILLARKRRWHCVKRGLANILDWNGMYAPVDFLGRSMMSCAGVGMGWLYKGRRNHL
jgi:hypothetical protein